jgi:hypothetical protein
MMPVFMRKTYHFERIGLMNLRLYMRRPWMLGLSLLALSLTLSACNLGTSTNNAPPTLAPRVTVTPPPTLGVAGNTSGGSQFAPSNINTPIADPDLEVFSLLNQVETDRLMAHINALQGFIHAMSIVSPFRIQQALVRRGVTSPNNSAKFSKPATDAYIHSRMNSPSRWAM